MAIFACSGKTRKQSSSGCLSLTANLQNDRKSLFFVKMTLFYALFSLGILLKMLKIGQKSCFLLKTRKNTIFSFKTSFFHYLLHYFYIFFHLGGLFTCKIRHKSVQKCVFSVFRWFCPFWRFYTFTNVLYESNVGILKRTRKCKNSFSKLTKVQKPKLTKKWQKNVIFDDFWPFFTKFWPFLAKFCHFWHIFGIFDDFDGFSKSWKWPKIVILA